MYNQSNIPLQDLLSTSLSKTVKKPRRESRLREVGHSGSSVKELKESGIFYPTKARYFRAPQ